MKYFAGVLIALYAFIATGQDAPAPSVTPAAPVMTPKIAVSTNPAPAETTPPAAAALNETAQTSSTPSAPVQSDNVSTGTSETASTETNAPPPPPPPDKDPSKYVVARFRFDGNFQPDVGGSTIPVTFSRSSASYLDGVPVNENSPRFVEGPFGKAVLIESAFANFFSIGQSSASTTSEFKPVQGAILSLSADKPWHGKEALAVETIGENNEEGFSAETQVEKAFYAKENASIMPAYYLASLYLKGQGNVKIVLKDIESGTASEPVYIDLPENWQRFSCLFAYPFRRIRVGANHETDWRKKLPAGTNISSHLQLICTTLDSQKMKFFADGLQLEQRYAFSSRDAELSPHTWVLGAFKTKQEKLMIDVKNDYFNTWKKTGSIAFWFKPLWEAHDNSNEIILQLAKNQLLLSHDKQKIIFAPAGVSFTPYEWKNNWHHIVVTWNEAGKRSLYIDGMEYPNTKGQMQPLKEPNSIMAGDFTKNLSPNGALDELSLYNITLNPEHAKRLASAEAAANAQPSPPVDSFSTEQTTNSKTPSDSTQQDEEEEK
ncbi:LamG-like jellyroll fold domain-containing protein [Verrucomicrobiota bacterium]